jgi:DNA-binding HxlR family transcriptional regulator
MRRSIPKRTGCAIHGLLQVLARLWTMDILWVLSTEGPTRFGVLRRKVEGISARMLSERLHHLEQKGFVYRHYEPTIPPAVTYGITKRMKDIGKILEEMNQLAEKWRVENSSAPRFRVRAAAPTAASLRGQ